MDKLNHDWLTEGLIDFEYKKYVLLAYLKDVKQHFDQSQLYPFMSDLIFHYKNLLSVKESRELLYENFPKTLSHADFQKLQIAYKKVIEDDKIIKEIEEIIVFAIPQIKSTMEEGKELYEFVEDNLALEPVGLIPIYAKEGYLFINLDSSKKIFVYRYHVTFFEDVTEKYRNIATKLVYHENKSLSKTFETLKIDLTKIFIELPNPATYLVTSKISFPIQETILPVAKRMLVRIVSS